MNDESIAMVEMFDRWTVIFHELVRVARTSLGMVT